MASEATKNIVKQCPHIPATLLQKARRKLGELKTLIERRPRADFDQGESKDAVDSISDSIDQAARTKDSADTVGDPDAALDANASLAEVLGRILQSIDALAQKIQPSR